MTINASSFVPGNQDMSNGISISVAGPNGDDNGFDGGCDTGTGSWDYSPWDTQGGGGGNDELD